METRIQSSSLHHSVFSLTRTFKTSPAGLFAAWTDPDLKARWFRGPAPWELLERRLELRVGGKELLHGRFGDGVETLYEATFHVITPDKCLIYAYDMHHHGVRLSVSLASVEFAPAEAGAGMTYTEQAVYFGQDGTQSRKIGTAALFDRLAAQLAGA